MPSDNFTMSENSGSFGMQQRQDRFDALGDLIRGPEGPAGKSAYQVAVDNGFVGTEEEWLASLVGPPGADGTVSFDELTPAQKESLRGEGVPAGGTTGQVLAKSSNTDYATRWVDAGGNASLTILSYGHSTWADFIAAYNSRSIVYCRASSGSDPASGSQTRMAFMAYVNSAASPTSVEFQYYRSVSTHSDSQQGDQVYVYKLRNTNGGTWEFSVREASTRIVAGSNMTSSYDGENGTLTLNATGGGTEMTILSYGNSTWADFIAAYNSSSIVYCRASVSIDPSAGSQVRMAYMAYVNHPTVPTSVDFLFYFPATHSDSQQGDQIFVYTLTNADGGTWSFAKKEASTKIVAGTNMTSSYANGTLTLGADLTPYRTAEAQDAIDAAQDAEIAGSKISHRNMLDNWFFKNPVNQRGQTQYSTAGAFVFDRWKLMSGTAELTSNGLVLNGTVQQTIEEDIDQQYTASVLTASGVSSASFNPSTKVFSFTSDGTAAIIAAKLELGSYQTLAHLEGTDWVTNEIPDYASQLAKCQRYLQIITNSSSSMPVATGYVPSAGTDIRVFLPLSVPMAYSWPSITLDGTAVVYPPSSSAVTVASVASSGYSFLNAVAFAATAASSVPQGGGLALRLNSGSKLIVAHEI